VLWKASDEADCGLVSLIQFFSHSCRDLLACELGELIVRHLSAAWISIRTTASRRLSRVVCRSCRGTTVQSAASWVRGRLERRSFQVNSESVLFECRGPMIFIAAFWNKLQFFRVPL
jgi:hypothetical protein